MHHFQFRNYALASSLFLVTGLAACSTGNESTTTAGSGGSSGSGTGGSTTAGSGGSGAGTGGSVAGTGGTIGGGGMDGGTGVPSVCDGTGTRPLTLTDTKIDNFEGATLDPGWYSFNDVMPMPDSFKLMIQAGGAATTAHSGHYAGMGAKTPLMMGYGVGASFNLAIDKTAMIYCVDISVFDGVTFWAKAAKAGSKIALNYVLPQTNKMKDGGDCPDASTNCYRHPQKSVTLTTDWAQYSVTFAEATGGTAKVTNRIQELVFISSDADWDFSIDEIQYYKGTPPVGPTSP
jgi:hypothetical protein